MQSLCRFERARLLFSQCAASLAPATRLASTQNVPAGHHNSDLSSTACNISLGRRRDISLRQDLTVHVDGKPAKLSDVFKVRHCASLRAASRSPSTAQLFGHVGRWPVRSGQRMR